MVCSAELKGSALPCLKDIYTRRCKTKARSIVKDLKDLSHPDKGLFVPAAVEKKIPDNKDTA